MELNNYLAKPNKTIRQHTDEVLEALDILYRLGYIKNEKLYNLTRLACEYHDYGKVNRYFQERVKPKEENGKRKKFDNTKEIGHNVLSVFFLDQEKFDSREDYLKVLNAVLNHHSYVDNFDILREEDEQIEDNLEGFATYDFSLKNLGRLESMIDDEDKELILVKGLLHRCDYSASGGVDVEYEADFLEESLENLLRTWKTDAKKKGYQEPKWNELQEYCMKNRDSNLIITAQTGMGKTEAGLHWIGNNKGFFVLPLRTAINAIYERAKELIGSKEVEKRLGLLHSDNRVYYMKNTTQDNENSKLLDYISQTKNYSHPLNISTPDQLFDFVFKYPSYEMKATMLSYSKIVIDEVQMYSPDLLAYLIYGLNRVKNLGGSYCILTATLAPFIKDYIKEKIGIDFKEETFVNDDKRHHLKVIEDELDIDLIEENYKKNSGKVLVVCNTVNKAQEVYSQLSKLNEGQGNKVVNLLHSKFIKDDRARKEKGIIDFGKAENIDNGIWVATQVVEASLDIDFDYLYTELSDINGLFQRLGRCNRRGEKSIDNINCYIFTEINRRHLKSGNNNVFIYKEMYNLSKKVLLDRIPTPRVIDEAEKVAVINTTFTKENILAEGGDYIEHFNTYYDSVEKLYPYERSRGETVKLFRNIISKNIIPKKLYEENFSEIKSALDTIEKSGKSYENKMEAEEIIKKYTISLVPYEVEGEIEELLELGKYTKIEIIDINYDSEYGFRKKTMETKKGKIEKASNIIDFD